MLLSQPVQGHCRGRGPAPTWPALDQMTPHQRESSPSFLMSVQPTGRGSCLSQTQETPSPHWTVASQVCKVFLKQRSLKPRCLHRRGFRPLHDQHLSWVTPRPLCGRIQSTFLASVPEVPVPSPPALCQGKMFPDISNRPLGYGYQMW